MTGLSRLGATTAMEALNLRKIGRRIELRPAATGKAEAVECTS